MRYAVALATLICLCPSPILSQAAPAVPSKNAVSNSADDIATIRSIEADLAKGEVTTNVDVLERVLAEDLVNLTPGGVGPGKLEILEGMRPHAGHAPPYSVEISDMRIYIIGETAVAAFVKTYTARENGHVAHEDKTDLFSRDHGRWKLKLSRASACNRD